MPFSYRLGYVKHRGTKLFLYRVHGQHPKQFVHDKDRDGWLLVTGYWLLVTGHWSLVTGHWSLVTGHWSNLQRTKDKGQMTNDK